MRLETPHLCSHLICRSERGFPVLSVSSGLTEGLAWARCMRPQAVPPTRARPYLLQLCRLFATPDGGAVAPGIPEISVAAVGVADSGVSVSGWGTRYTVHHAGLEDTRGDLFFF